ncbi:MAG: ABC transporter ATP-binding protein [Clostridiales bacterium]|jgi:ATP-binding cassette subfamily B protein|nr:ABC transporter ATP-binding protein [Clostridiales bacterium]
MNDNAIRWLYKVPAGKKLYILALTIVQCLNGASGVLYAVFLRDIVNSAVDRDKQAFIQSSIFIVLLILVQLTLSAISRWLSELSRATLENLFKERLMHNILRKDFSRVTAVHSGEWLNRLTSDTTVIANNYTEIIPGFAGMAVKMISALVMITILDVRFAIIIIPLGIVLALLTFAFRKRMKKLHKGVQEKDGALRVFMQERIGSLTVIRSFAAEDQTEADTHAKASAHKKARMKRTRFSNICNFGFGGAMNGMYVFGIIYCAYGILTGTISYGTLTAIAQLITQIQSPFANITGYLPRWYQMLASAERLMEIEKFDDDIVEDAKSREEAAGFYRDSLAGIGLDNVSFTYYPSTNTVEDVTKDNMPVAVEGLSLAVKKGEYVAFTGHSGCGKSTALMLLMGIYKPDSGERYAELADGSRTALEASWHRLFAYVPQGNKLMSGTVRDIVSFAEKAEDAAADEKIDRALKIACADEFISELDNGIDTVLGERGTGLSEGQMQRIAIARALYSDAPVLLLDEATSALDEVTEKKLLENLRALTDKTVVIVTHRAAALEICDREIEF